MAGIDYADVVKTIIQACRPGTYSIENYQVCESLGDEFVPAPSVIIYAEGAAHRDDSRITRSSRIPVSIYCRGTSKQNCLNVAQEVTDAIDYWEYNHAEYTRTSTVSYTTMVSATSVIYTSPVRVQNCANQYSDCSALDMAANFEGEYAGSTTFITSSIVLADTCKWTFGTQSIGVVHYHTDDATESGTIVIGDIADAVAYTTYSHFEKTYFWFNNEYIFFGSTSNVLRYGTTSTPSFAKAIAGADLDYRTFYNLSYRFSMSNNTENAWLRFKLPYQLLSAYSVHSAILSLPISNLTEVSGGTYLVKGITSQVLSFTTISEISAYGLTTAAVSNQAVSSTTITINVTAIMQENVTASQPLYQYTGFQISPDTNLIISTITNPSLIIEYSSTSPANPPSKILKLNDGRPERVGDNQNTWEVQLAYNLLYNGTSKVIS